MVVGSRETEKETERERSRERHTYRQTLYPTSKTVSIMGSWQNIREMMVRGNEANAVVSNWVVERGQERWTATETRFMHEKVKKEVKR